MTIPALTRQELFDALTDKKPLEKAVEFNIFLLDIFSPLIALSPGWQSAAASYKKLADFIPKASTENQVELLFDVFSRLSTLENLTEILKDKKFKNYVRKMVDVVKNEQSETKKAAFRSCIINVALKKNASDYEVEFFTRTLIDLTDIQLDLISYFDKPEEKLIARGINAQALKSQSGGESEIMRKVFDGLDISLIENQMRELRDKKLIDIPDFGVMSTENTYTKLTTNRITPIGKKFIDFCMT